MTRDKQHLEIYLDLTDPAAYLALPGTLGLLASTGCSASWHPLRCEPYKPPGTRPGADADRGVWHRWFRASYRQRELHYYAGVLGLPRRHTHSTVEPTGAATCNMPILWLEQLGAPATAAGKLLLNVVRQHYAHSQPCLNNEQQLAQLLSESGFNGEDFADYCNTNGRAALDAALAEATRAGVIRGPAYRLQEALYIGREHLPLLAEQLG